MSEYADKYVGKVLNTEAIIPTDIIYQIPSKLGPYRKIPTLLMNKHSIIIETPILECVNNIEKSNNMAYDILTLRIDRNNKYHAILYDLIYNIDRQFINTIDKRKMRKSYSVNHSTNKVEDLKYNFPVRISKSQTNMTNFFNNNNELCLSSEFKENTKVMIILEIKYCYISYNDIKEQYYLGVIWTANDIKYIK